MREITKLLALAVFVPFVALLAIQLVTPIKGDVLVWFAWILFAIIAFEY
jgi:hypothetical protein